MFPGRSKASLSRFFIEQGPRWCQNVQTVVSDGSRSYQTAIIRYLPSARHVLDRFHAVRWFTPRPHPGTPRTATPPAPRRQTRLPPGPVPRPVRVTQKNGPSHPKRADTSQTAIRDVSASEGSLGRSTGALRPVRGRRPPHSSPGPGTVRQPVRNRPDTRVLRHCHHCPQLVKRDPQLAPTPDDPTGPWKASTTSSKPSAEPHTGSPTPTTTPPEHSS